MPATAVREQLERILNSPGFVSSTRLSRFLTHIVNRTIEGDLDSQKEFSVAMEVFDRSPDYDPNIDAMVRVQARRLRQKLKAYYEEDAGKNDPVLIAKPTIEATLPPMEFFRPKHLVGQSFEKVTE